MIWLHFQRWRTATGSSSPTSMTDSNCFAFRGANDGALVHRRRRAPLLGNARAGCGEFAGAPALDGDHDLATLSGIGNRVRMGIRHVLLVAAGFWEAARDVSRGGRFVL